MMSQSDDFQTDPNGGFPHLPHAPIVEAVIHWLAQAGKQLEPRSLQEQLTQRLPDYPLCQPQQGLEISATGGPGGASELVQRTRWNGFRLEKKDVPYVVQFTPQGVVFSRLAPYETWESFETEAMRFWDVFVELAEPPVIQRLGVRFINRIRLSEGSKAGDFLRGIPAPVEGIEVSSESFLHQDTFKVPGQPYHINWLRTIQPPQPKQVEEKGLIVDIDVWTTDITSLNRCELGQRLADMRKLKNKMFFNCMTDHALRLFGKQRI